MIDICSVSSFISYRIIKEKIKVNSKFCNKLNIPVDVEVGEHQVADSEAEHREGDSEAIEQAAGDLLVVQAGDHQLRVQRRVETSEVSAQLTEGCGESWQS